MRSDSMLRGKLRGRKPRPCSDTPRHSPSRLVRSWETRRGTRNSPSRSLFERSSGGRAPHPSKKRNEAHRARGTGIHRGRGRSSCLFVVHYTADAFLQKAGQVVLAFHVHAFALAVVRAAARFPLARLMRWRFARAAALDGLGHSTKLSEGGGSDQNSNRRSCPDRGLSAFF